MTRPVLRGNDELWKCQDGREVPVGDLEPEHLRNILRLLIRKAQSNREIQERIDNQLAEEIWREGKDW